MESSKTLSTESKSDSIKTQGVKPILMFVVNVPEFFISHRIAVAIAAQRAGYDVHVATANGNAVSAIVESGFVHHILPLSRSGSNPLREIVTLWSMYRLFRQTRPSLVHLVTVKPNLYGGIAARLAKVPGVIAAVSGLGHIFGGSDARSNNIRVVVKALYRLAYGHANLTAIFQNTEDRTALTRITGLPPERTRLIRGSGVDMSEYKFIPEVQGKTKVLFASRLLKTKGILDFVEAGRLLRNRGTQAEFLVAGEIDAANPASLSDAELSVIAQEGIVKFLGHRKDMSALISAAHIIALPSYYGEGLPKILIEAASCGRAIVTTDHPGCRDAIIPNKTGLLVPPKDIHALAEAIDALITDTPCRHSFGLAGRLFAEKTFSIESVIEAHLKIYRDVEAASSAQ